MKVQLDAGKPKRRTGRPLSFDRDTVLRAAMLTFWRTGYETTSVGELTRAMGITAPSLYAAFGDKRRLFLEAVALYRGNPADQSAAIEAAATSRDAAEMMLTASVERFTGTNTPPGCLMASSVATGSDAAAKVRAEVSAIRGEIANQLRQRITRDVAEGVLPPGTDGEALAATVMCTTMGLSVLARDGADRDTLSGVAEQVMRGWPRA